MGVGGVGEGEEEEIRSDEGTDREVRGAGGGWGVDRERGGEESGQI